MENIFKIMRITLMFILTSSVFASDVSLGLDQLFSLPYVKQLEDKKIGVITNQTSINSQSEHILDLFAHNQKLYNYHIKAIFAPEHGLEGKLKAFEHFEDTEKDSIKVFSLHGKTKRPTAEILKGINLLIYDIQTVGSRCYTYETTLFYCIEEAAKNNIPLVVLDRPNPMGGLNVEGHMLNGYKCFFGYIEIPFCHGMTIGELANYFNYECNIGCDLQVIPVKGWNRNQLYNETKLNWTPPSPNIKDAFTTLTYPATVLLSESLEVVSADRNGDEPFKKIGAPWINRANLTEALNQRNLPGVHFDETVFTPQSARYQDQECYGVYLTIINPHLFKPILTQYVLFDTLMELYPEDFQRELLRAEKMRRGITVKYLSGSKDLFERLKNNQETSKYMKAQEAIQLKEFLEKRKKHLLY